MQNETTLVRDQAGDNPVAKALMGAAAGAAGTFMLDQADTFLWDHEDPASRDRTTAVRPNGEPPSNVLVSRIEQLAGTKLKPEQHEQAGFATHYAIGVAPAIGYALLRDKLPGKGVGRGALFGLGLFLLQDELFNTVSGLGAKPRDYPWQAHARGLVAHLVYGVTTELALSGMEKAVGKNSND